MRLEHLLSGALSHGPSLRIGSSPAEREGLGKIHCNTFLLIILGSLSPLDRIATMPAGETLDRDNSEDLLRK